jgi:hypothetical protein
VTAIVDEAQLLLPQAVDAFVRAEGEVLADAEGCFLALDSRGLEGRPSLLLEKGAVGAVEILNRAVVFAEQNLDRAGSKGHLGLALLDMNIEIGQLLLDYGEAEFLGGAAGRPFHDADDALGIELYLHVEVARGELNAVRNALQGGRGDGCRRDALAKGRQGTQRKQQAERRRPQGRSEESHRACSFLVPTGIVRRR